MKKKIERKVSQSFVPDIMNRRDIITHFKDLIDIGPMLIMDWEEEMSKFRKKLEEVGWGEEPISDMIQTACLKSIYMQKIPATIRGRGNWRAWLDNRARTK